VENGVEPSSSISTFQVGIEQEPTVAATSAKNTPISISQPGHIDQHVDETASQVTPAAQPPYDITAPPHIDLVM